MEDYGCLHGAENAVACGGGGMVQEVYLVYTAIFGFCCGLTDYSAGKSTSNLNGVEAHEPFDHIHIYG